MSREENHSLFCPFALSSEARPSSPRVDPRGMPGVFRRTVFVLTIITLEIFKDIKADSGG